MNKWELTDEEKRVAWKDGLLGIQKAAIQKVVEELKKHTLLVLDDYRRFELSTAEWQSLCEFVG